jgi:UDP-N-acetylmuramate--alanine ligase
MLAQKYHFVGIGGIGMSGLAHVLLERGVSVSGTDIAINERIEKLQKKGASIAIGHAAKHVPKDTTLVFSTDIPSNNPELQFARTLQLPLLHRSDLLHILMVGYKPLLVTGTHGKTTSSSLLASVLAKMDFQPAYALGGVLADSGLNASHAPEGYFVAEADESDGTFIKYDPYGAIITNIDNDHMNFYKTHDALCAAFTCFSEKVLSKEHLFYCADDPGLRASGIVGTGYGFTPKSACQGSNFSQNGWNIRFDVKYEGKTYHRIEVPLSGFHNALNALAVFGLSLKLGVAENAIRESLLAFKGVKRRLERIGEVNQILVLDDYGHHPTEIETTLKGIKNAMPDRRLIVLFQPHRFTRTRDCLQQFGTCFRAADELFITDIYAANETALTGIDASAIVQQVKIQSSVSVRYVPKADLAINVLQLARSRDVIVTLGAGDICKEGPKLLIQMQ